MKDGTADVDSETSTGEHVGGAIADDLIEHDRHSGSHIENGTDSPDKTSPDKTSTDKMSPLDGSGEPQAAVVPATAHLTRRARRKQRVSKWDRPPEPHDWRFFVGHLGRILIATGLLLFGFVAYQLWGTGIETARAQNKLDGQFEQIIAEQRADAGDNDNPTPVTNIVTDDGLVIDPTNDDAAFRALPLPSVRLDESGVELPPTEYEEVVPAAEQNLPVVNDEVPLGQIVIPDIGVDYKFVSGVTREALKKGVGYFGDTPLPGQLGNSALAGHRTTYGHPFGRLDEIVAGNDVVITLNNGLTYTYVVTGSVVVEPHEYYVISDSDPARATLTLITCTPEHTSTHRLAVFA
ncbi:MAG TPA: sortase, partial [Ilumatobacter sp.]|nr:sortase [Ilumatobacter sp.]